MVLKHLIRRYKGLEETIVRVLNEWFNSQTIKVQRLTVFAFVVFGFIACLIISTQQKTRIKPRIGSITFSESAIHKSELHMKKEVLIPIGKMKGEVNGEYDSFYVAIDRNAAIFINRNINYSDSAFQKGRDWQEVSRQKLAEYEKHLHFLPVNRKSKSLSMK
jgi:hypothetical protein